MNWYRDLVEASPAGVLVVAAGRILYANTAAARLCAVRTPASLVERVFLNLVDVQSRTTLRDHLERCERGEALAPIDVRLVADAQSAGRTVMVAAAPCLAHGAPALQLLLHDVTERSLRDAALRENEERLSLAVAGALEGVWDWNLETNAVTYSERWKQMLGYSGDEIEPHVSAWERLVHPDDRVGADLASESIATGERQTYEAEFRLRHKNGHYVHVLSRGFPVRAPDGRVTRIVGTHLDVTERKRAEAALRENEERLELAFAGAQEGVWDWDLETGAVVYSSRWAEMLGYREDDIEPHVRAWERLLHPDDLARAAQVRAEVEAGAETYEGEFRLRHKQGHYVHVLSRGYPVRREPGGPVVRIVGTHFDLTARRQAEAERTRAEFLTRLVFAQEDERRRIAREMHDQFGEQLTALAQRIHMLKRSGSSDWQSHVDALEAIAQQLDRDVDHLVWELRPTALDDLGLRAALANYVRTWSARTGVAATLHMTGLVDDRLPSPAETALYRIAQEALTNVAKHARASRVEVILERRGDQVLLVVEDDGVGFENGAAGPTADGGFGLAGMKERASLVGATLEIESSPGAGTTILVRVDTTIAATATTHA